MSLSNPLRLAFLWTIICLSPLKAQESQIGLEVTTTITLGATFTDRFKNTIPESLARLKYPRRSSREFFAPGARVLIAPTLKLGRHWYLHATWQGHSTPFFPYEAYHVYGNGVRGRLLQAFGAYTTATESKSLTIKAGKLPTAFGHFATRYNDRDNPLIDSPLAYGSYLLLRPDLIPCSSYDFEHQQEVHPNVSAYHCKHTESYSYGILPVSPYGRFGAELDLTWHRLDGRLQLANSSPSNPQKFNSSSQAAQFSGGAGLTLIPGLRTGVSAFRGPWLESSTQSQLQTRLHWRQFDSSGLGFDAQWAYSHFAVSGEWQRLTFNYPNLTKGPSVNYSYIEAKWTLHPQWFTATRLGSQRHGMINDRFGAGQSPYLPNRAAYEASVGYRPIKGHIVKTAYTWLHSSIRYGPSDNVFALQWVVDAPNLSWTR